MLFKSTRTDQGRRYTFQEAVLAGWAEDAGMLLPEAYPHVNADTLRSWANLDFRQIFVEVFLRW